ncbi:GIY-YIG nuclease family protein [Halomonas sp. HP20-15]|uniref:GIY-YIG nuclease family protein n=1 Tax=Halomonas sp. HP20-15 TaxID=3085901 RepID=UPI002981C43C|nr:GIY-YIG nuclease family protein [Halomonas sp. HP20-15]MDW5375844.1 GIY-YIG nuclease family protein [Halomonas sp. HP20-15]
MTSPQARPTSIRIFLADGTPEGLRIVEKSNWTGRAVVANRSQLEGALKRSEMAQPGVYVLTGQTDDGAAKLYVGEADVLGERIKQHVAGKEFWTRVIAFTSTNEGLNKASVRYLEARLLGLAKTANQWAVDNTAYPSPPPLNEADSADAEWFLAEMLVIFPLLGIDAFESASSQAKEISTDPVTPSLTLYLDERGAKGTAREVTDGFVVLKGSFARAEETASIHNYMREQRQTLKARGVLAPQDGALVFTQDFRFSSPSTAAGVLVGGASNGRTAWKDASGKTLKALQEARLEKLEKCL